QSTTVSVLWPDKDSSSASGTTSDYAEVESEIVARLLRARGPGRLPHSFCHAPLRFDDAMHASTNATPRSPSCTLGQTTSAELASPRLAALIAAAASE